MVVPSKGGNLVVLEVASVAVVILKPCQLVQLCLVVSLLQPDQVDPKAVDSVAAFQADVAAAAVVAALGEAFVAEIEVGLVEEVGSGIKVEVGLEEEVDLAEHLMGLVIVQRRPLTLHLVQEGLGEGSVLARTVVPLLTALLPMVA